MNATGSRDLKIWLADGTNYPGQGDIRGRQDRLADSLEQIYARIGETQRLVLEYKFFEPAFYTDVRPALATWRESRGLDCDPMAAYAASGYQAKIAADRVGGTQARWGA